jgi:hypothetical protein
MSKVAIKRVADGRETLPIFSEIARRFKAIERGRLNCSRIADANPAMR